MSYYVADEALGCINGTLDECLDVAERWARTTRRIMYVRAGSGKSLFRAEPNGSITRI